jgi:hypothetical protein
MDDSKSIFDAALAAASNTLSFFDAVGIDFPVLGLVRRWEAELADGEHISHFDCVAADNFAGGRKANYVDQPQRLYGEAAFRRLYTAATAQLGKLIS